MQTACGLRAILHDTPAPAQFNGYNGAPSKPGEITPGMRKAMHW
jgi:hypothetical protein